MDSIVNDIAVPHGEAIIKFFDSKIFKDLSLSLFPHYVWKILSYGNYVESLHFVFYKLSLYQGLLDALGNEILENMEYIDVDALVEQIKEKKDTLTKE